MGRGRFDHRCEGDRVHRRRRRGRSRGRGRRHQHRRGYQRGRLLRGKQDQDRRQGLYRRRRDGRHPRRQRRSCGRRFVGHQRDRRRGFAGCGLRLNAGVAVAVGLSLGFNEISNDVEAYISNADQGVTTTGGDITISAVSQGQHLFDLTVGGLITAANLDDAATADTDNPDDPVNGTDDVDSRFDDAVNEAVVRTPRMIVRSWKPCVTAFAANGETLAMYDIVATAAKYGTGDGDAGCARGRHGPVGEGLRRRRRRRPRLPLHREGLRDEQRREQHRPQHCRTTRIPRSGSSSTSSRCRSWSKARAGCSWRPTARPMCSS